MTRHVALLRAVNVGGRGKLAMADLKAIAASLDLSEISTVLQSGNVVFTASASSGELEDRFETALSSKLGLATDVLIRSAAQWRRLVAANPFAAAADADPSHLLLLVCKKTPTPEGKTTLRRAISGREHVVVADGAAYALYPDGIGRSKLTAALIERHLGTPTTGRNWSTVLKIATLLGL